LRLPASERGNVEFVVPTGNFGNVLAVHRGMRSRGWDGAVLNPPEESMVANWHRAHREYLFGEGDA
jgi:hypothetical protein